MKPLERDGLLARLDERTANIYSLCEKLENHQSISNGRIGRLEQDVSAIQSLQQERYQPTKGGKYTTWGAIGTAITALILVLIEYFRKSS